MRLERSGCALKQKIALYTCYQSNESGDMIFLNIKKQKRVFVCVCGGGGGRGGGGGGNSLASAVYRQKYCQGFAYGLDGHGSNLNIHVRL